MVQSRLGRNDAISLARHVHFEPAFPLPIAIINVCKCEAKHVLMTGTVYAQRKVRLPEIKLGLVVASLIVKVSLMLELSMPSDLNSLLDFRHLDFEIVAVGLMVLTASG